MSEAITRPMVLSASTLGFMPRGVPADTRIMLPVVPPVDTEVTLPHRGMNLLTGVTAPKILGAALRRYDSGRYRHYSVNLKVTVQRAIPSNQLVEPEYLADTELLIFENTRMSIPLATAIQDDWLLILQERYGIGVDKLAAYAPRAFRLLAEHPYLLADLAELPQYAHLKAMIYVLPGDTTARHRFLYLRDLSLISNVIIAGEYPDMTWRLPTQAELDQPPASYTPFARR